MKFARDILLIDIETTGNNPQKDFALQISGLLLDKDNLLEKDTFSTYIRHPFSQSTNDRIVQTLGITKEQWMKSPSEKEAIQAFTARFPLNVTLATQNITNILFLKEMYQQVRIPYEFDYHIIELWTLAHVFFARQNLKKIPTAETLATHFKIPRGREHNSADTCKLLAELFRRILNQQSYSA
jgi:DNA polymerase III alpha subunit (gram-positive type)